MRSSSIALLTLGLAAGAGCTGDPTNPPAGTVLTGEWSSQEVLLSLDLQGGTTEYGCAHGGLDAPVVLDPWGRFEVAGVHIREHGGPIHEDEAVDSIPALYRGELLGDRLSFTVRAGADTLGPFLLRRDGHAQIAKCL